MTTNVLPTNGANHNGEHLSEELLNRYLDGDLAHEERQAADLHLAVCDGCSTRLAELMTIATLLRELPEIRAPRSFQLDPSHARKPMTLWQRFGAALLPALPAMRAGTIALALAFASVTAYRVVDDPAETGTFKEDSALQSEPMTSTSIAPTFTIAAAGRGVETVEVATETANQDEAADSGLASEPPAAEDQPFIEEDESGSSADSELEQPGDGGDAAPAGESADDASEETMTMFEAPDESDGESDSAEPEASDSTSLEMVQMAPEASPSAEATPTVTALPTESATATATATTVVPTPLPTEVPAPAAQEGSDDSSWLGRAQLVLGVMLALLGGLVVGVQRLRRKVTG
jgi:hypothetical protein